MLAMCNFSGHSAVLHCETCYGHPYTSAASIWILQRRKLLVSSLWGYKNFRLNCVLTVAVHQMFNILITEIKLVQSSASLFLREHFSASFCSLNSLLHSLTHSLSLSFSLSLSLSLSLTHIHKLVWHVHAHVCTCTHTYTHTHTLTHTHTHTIMYFCISDLCGHTKVQQECSFTIYFPSVVSHHN